MKIGPELTETELQTYSEGTAGVQWQEWHKIITAGSAAKRCGRSSINGCFMPLLPLPSAAVCPFLPFCPFHLFLSVDFFKNMNTVVHL